MKEGIWSCSRKARMILGDAFWARLANKVDRIFREDTSNPTSLSALRLLGEHYRARQGAEFQGHEAMP